MRGGFVLYMHLKISFLSSDRVEGIRVHDASEIWSSIFLVDYNIVKLKGIGRTISCLLTSDCRISSRIEVDLLCMMCFFAIKFCVLYIS